MEQMELNLPVVKLPSKRKPSLSPSYQSSNYSSSQNEFFDPRDYLVSDVLYLSKIPRKIKETDIRTLLQHCLPTEILLDQEGDTGQLRFNHPKYADRAYSLYNGFTFTNNSKLELQMYKDKRLDPEATAALLEINNLPENYDDNKLYDLFRPFGPLNLCKCILYQGSFRGTAFVQFFYPMNSDEAVLKLNGLVVEGNELSVVPFMPSTTHAPQQYQQQQQEEPLKNNTTEEHNSVDLMNLYVKNLEPQITNLELNNAFRRFGRIVSARVMTTPHTGQSKGYGFVSFSKSEEASAALKAMNGAMLGNRPLIVAYHEPRKPRPNNNNNQQSQQQQQQQQQQQAYNFQEYKPNTYYNQDQQSVQSNNMPSNNTVVNSHSMDNVDELGINMKLKDLSIGQKPATLHAATINLPQRKNSDVALSIPSNNKLSPQFSSSPISGASTGKSLASLASGLSIQPPPHAVSQKPTLRRRGSLESVMTESSANIQRSKLEHAVRQCGEYGKAVDDIVDMLLTLKRKERSLCLFNPDFLHAKVQSALDALATCVDSESEDEPEDEDVDGLDSEYVMRNNRSNITENKTSSDLFSPISPLDARITKTIIPTHSSHSKSNKEIIKKEVSGSSMNRDIEALLMSIEGKPIHEQKQLLGDQLFPLVKMTGTKQAPKVTIRLLDTVNLHELAHIMFDTPLLKIHVEKAFNSL